MRAFKVGLVIVLGVLLFASLSFGSQKLNPIIDSSVTGQDLTLFENAFSSAVVSLFSFSLQPPLPGREVVEIATETTTLKNPKDPDTPPLNIEHMILPGARLTFTVNQNLINQSWAALSFGGWKTSSLVFELIAYPSSGFSNRSFQQRANKSLANFQILRGLTLKDIAVVIDHKRMPSDSAPLLSLEKESKKNGIPVYDAVQELKDAAQKDIIFYIAHNPKACFGDANHAGPVFNELANVDLHGKLLIFLVCGSSDPTWDRWFETKQDDLIYKRGAAAVISFDREIFSDAVKQFADELFGQQPETAIMRAITNALSKITATGNDYRSNDLMHAMEIKTGLAWTAQYD